MQKVYLLLRNNQQTGPYTLEEVLQLNLKPFDLVWVEGRSAGWRYPGEIDSLKAYVPQTPQPEVPFKPIDTAAMEAAPPAPLTPEPLQTTTTAAKNVFVSMPGRAPQVPLHIYEEEVPVAPPPVNHEAYIPPPVTPPVQPVAAEDIPLPKFKRTVNELEEDYTNWMYKQKATKKKTFATKDLLVAAGLVALIIVGYFIFSRPALIAPAKETPVARQPETVQPSTANNAQVATPNNNIPVTSETIATFQENKSKEPVVRAKETTQKPLGEKQKAAAVITDNKTASSQETPIQSEKKEDVLADVKMPDNQTTLANEPKEKKKKVRDMVKDIFTRKDKKETAKTNPPILEEPKPATDRKAAKRDESTGSSNDETATAPSLADQVDISSNAPDNWMMGVTGLKVTLRNRNAVPLQTAVVNVYYYDSNNQLLERKMVYFNNVPAKGKMTQAAPDHKFADHVDFKLGPVSGKDDRYAKD